MLNQLGLTKVTIDLPFRLNHVNCYLAENEKGLTIIDTGLNNDQSRMTWEKYVGNKQVEKLFITHYHPDHYGYAGELQQRTGASVWMSEVDTALADKFLNDESTGLTKVFFELCGVGEDLLVQLADNSTNFRSRVTPQPRVDYYFEENKKVVIGELAYDVIFTPGHSSGLVCFYNKEKDVLISTDHILPKITPNISCTIYGLDNPLANYFESLQKIKQLDASYVIPSHGEPFYHANQRIDEIIAHHDERLERTLEILTSEVTVLEASKQLFRKELTVHEMNFAIGETMAHLEYLYHKNECVKENVNGRLMYYRK
ncbi:MBL fold metallo-hydrolase [Desertibacillus haloalkaliphilus]|uniref:MBL fold metallo-hydrolase n=1 Tax=Desertibacillus haloalkaliphilus TaxID=1328930 RepID=UPI001C25F351|nr:MBL fold metallo-hydrolase [Desertibacillus haloalkaliphilus]MBU8906107.1 MBL fold metallo-hydrolase [Desertibacillus haloalkaliphilus]